MAEEAARFAGRVRKNLGLPVELADERLSSWEAGPDRSKRLRRVDGRREASGQRDEVAAAVILRDYLSRTRSAASGADQG